MSNVIYLRKDDGSIQRIETVPASAVEQAQPETRQTHGRHICEILADRSEVRWIPGLEDILELGVIAIGAGQEGLCKSAWARQQGLRAAAHGAPFFYLDGEPAGLDRSFDAMLRAFWPSVDQRSLPAYSMNKRGLMNLTTREGIAQLRAELDAVNFRGGLVACDTMSKFTAGLALNENDDVSAWLSTMRFIPDEYDSTFLAICHVGHGDKTRAKGASSLIQDTDSAYVFSKSRDVISVSRNRFKTAPSLPALQYQPRIVDLERVDKRGKTVTGLVLDDAVTHPEVDHAKTLPRPGTKTRQAYDAAIAVIQRTGVASVDDVRAAMVNALIAPEGKDTRSKTATTYLNRFVAEKHIYKHDGDRLTETGVLPADTTAVVPDPFDI